MKLKRNGNAVFLLNYHLILIVKYRKKIFKDEKIIESLKNYMATAGEKYGVEVINQECGDDHIHLLVSTKPTTDLTKYINIAKGHSSRMLRKEFSEELSKELYGDSLWSDSYYLSTVGNVSVDSLYKYIDEQRIK